MSTGPRETIVTALLTLLTSSIDTTFTADTTIGSAVLSNVTGAGPLFIGMPVGSGSLFPISTFVAGLSPLTLSELATASASGATFATGFRTVSRRLRYWQDVAEQPALFVRNVGDEVPKRPARELPTVTTMECESWIYSKIGLDQNLAPSTGLNNLIDAVKAALDPLPPKPQTLGLSTVQHCWIEGRIDMHPGDLDGQAIAVIPIKILSPGL
jgi:hypothetical protein